MQTTKKNKRGINKKKIWSLFNDEIPELKKLECLYSKSEQDRKVRDKCDLCDFHLACFGF